MTKFFVEYTLQSNGSPLMHNSYFFECPVLNQAVILEIKSTLHQQAVDACQQNRFSQPHSSATIERTYLQIVNITILGE